MLLGVCRPGNARTDRAAPIAGRPALNGSTTEAQEDERFEVTERIAIFRPRRKSAADMLLVLGQPYTAISEPGSSASKVSPYPRISFRSTRTSIQFLSSRISILPSYAKSTKDVLLFVLPRPVPPPDDRHQHCPPADPCGFHLFLWAAGSDLSGDRHRFRFFFRRSTAGKNTIILPSSQGLLMY